MIGETSSFRSKSLDERNSLGFNSYATLQGLWNIISKNFMNPDADLEDALTFVVRRIEGEAMRSGKPLTEDEGLLLNNLPITPLFPLTPGNDPEFPPMPVPRDLAYERLIALAKEARRDDLRVDSMSDRKWRYAATVCKLHKHPMSWLLRWSGIREQKLWWDGSLLIISAILLVCCFLALILWGIVETWTRLGWITGGLGYFVLVLLVFFGSRYIEDWQLRREVDKYRLTARDLPRQVS